MLKEFFIPLNLNRLSTSEFSQFNTTTLKSIEKTRIKLTEHPKVNQAVSRLNNSLLLLEPGIKQEKPVTGKDLREADKKRDRAKKHLEMTIEVAKHSRNDNKRAAALEIDRILVNYKFIHRENYEKQTKHMNQLIQRLEKSPYREKINQIGANEQVQNLKENQENFYQLYLTYTQYQGQNITKKVAAARKDIKEQYTILYQYLICEVYWDNNSPLKPLLLAINDCRKDYSKLLNRRTKKTKTNTALNEETVLLPT